ncbi:hypothetical protein HDV00_001099 [Rhizophlyctis rosea]|nr:hypothetical protein HDV00_001099 [Rhizophlyctis rosea]
MRRTTLLVPLLACVTNFFSPTIAAPPHPSVLKPPCPPSYVCLYHGPHYTGRNVSYGVSWDDGHIETRWANRFGGEEYGLPVIMSAWNNVPGRLVLANSTTNRNVTIFTNHGNPNLGRFGYEIDAVISSPK